MEKNDLSDFVDYFNGTNTNPFLLQGDCLELLKDIPDESIDCVITSPPYWLQREYENGGIGREKHSKTYVGSLLQIILEIKRVLTKNGSFWLNLNDTYHGKSLSAIPWRVAISMIDDQKWILRNSVIWNKMKGGMDSSNDRLNNVHENIFHFVKSEKYFYDLDAIRTTPRKAIIKDGSVISATGVSGVRYKRRIELSTCLSDEEKINALSSLDEVLKSISDGKLSDFRMVIRGHHRSTHSDNTKVSGRARELRDKGFYFLKYNPKGSKPSDVWEITPEDTQKRGAHFAPFPEDLCRIPILSTCPVDGIVLDPFVGTGTTCSVAYELGRKSIGIDIASSYLKLAKSRLKNKIKG